MNNKTKILVSGSVAYDQIMNFAGRFKDNILPEKIHILNVSFFIHQLKESFGGTAGNIAYNLALLGEKPTLLANVGKDFLPYNKWLKKNRIDQSRLKIDKNEKTPVAYIITDKDDNQISGFYPGAIKKPYQLNQKIFNQGCLAIIAPDNPVNYLNLSKIYRQKKVPYIFDPGQQMASLSGADLKRSVSGANVFISNDYELSLALKKMNWKIEKLQKEVEILVTTLGSKGSIIYHRGRKINIPSAKPKNTSDPTGAGDAYRAGLIKGIISGWPLEKTGRLASLVAVYTVEKYGTQTHHFTWTELQKRYRQNFGEKI
ncbi:MAG: carbohydrate kinase family protein [Patescibacteria group bacterium]|nr:carbohydrate kinase family protein [Patescibacteria group bacterium]